MNTSSTSADGDEANKRSQWNGFFMGVFMCLMVRHVSNNFQSWWDGGPTAKVPVQSAVDRSQATLAYWRTAVWNLHESRFKMPSSELPADQVSSEIMNRFKTLSDQARVAPWDNVDRDLVSMAIRHSAIDKKAIQLKAQADELKKLYPTSTANSISFNEANRQWEQVADAVQADTDMLNKLPEGPLRKLVVSALELDQLILDQLHEIEAMQATLQQRYPGTHFPLPDIGE